MIPIDYDKLSKYIEINLSLRHLRDEHSKYYIIGFRRCTDEDFRSNNFEGAIPLPLEKIVCPATEKFPELFKIKNTYSNVYDRVSFNIEVVTCSDE